MDNPTSGIIIVKSCKKTKNSSYDVYYYNDRLGRDNYFAYSKDGIFGTKLEHISM